jgi:hypothetical protein
MNMLEIQMGHAELEYLNDLQQLSCKVRRLSFFFFLANSKSDAEHNVQESVMLW